MSHEFAYFLHNPELLRLKLKVQEILTVMLTSSSRGPPAGLHLSNQSAYGGENVPDLFVFNLLMYHRLDLYIGSHASCNTNSLNKKKKALNSG